MHLLVLHPGSAYFTDSLCDWHLRPPSGSSRVASNAFLVIDTGVYLDAGNPGAALQPTLVYEARLDVNDNTGRLRYDPDGSGPLAAITLANFNGKPGLTVTDITLI